MCPNEMELQWSILIVLYPYLTGLVAASVEVFSAKGFDGASMEDLSRHLGISKSAIYHHVTSKDELLGLALNRALDALDRVVQDSRALPSGPRDQLEHLLRASVDVLFAERPYVALLLRVRGNTEVERAAMTRRREFDTYVAGLRLACSSGWSTRSPSGCVRAVIQRWWPTPW